MAITHRQRDVSGVLAGFALAVDTGGKFCWPNRLDQRLSSAVGVYLGEIGLCGLSTLDH